MTGSQEDFKLGNLDYKSSALTTGTHRPPHCTLLSLLCEFKFYGCRLLNFRVCLFLRVANPDPTNKNSIPTFGYRNVLPLNKNASNFQVSHIRPTRVIHLRKNMVAVHFATIACKLNAANRAYNDYVFAKFLHVLPSSRYFCRF